MNKQILFLFILAVGMSFSGLLYAAPKPPPAPKIEIDDPLLEDDLFEETRREEDEKAKSGPADITIQTNTPVEENPIVEKPPPLSPVPPPAPVPPKKAMNESVPINKVQAIESPKPSELESALKSQVEIEKSKSPEAQQVDSNAPIKMKGRDREARAVKPRVSSNKKVEEGLPRWNASDPGKGFVNSDDQGYYYKEESSDSGVKEYGDDPVVKPKARNYANGLQSVSSDGSYLYTIEESELEGSASLRIASMPSLPLANKVGITYEDIYGNVPITMALIDYDWLSFRSFGHWVLSVGTGLGTVDGPGRFIDDFTEARETYSLYVLLNHITFIYRFQYSKKPWFVPYVSLGVVPAILFERRDDDKRNKIAFSPSVHGSGGVRFNLGRLDPYGGGQLDAEYGINNMWLDVEFRRLQSFSKEIDISSNLFNLGLGFDF